MKKRSKIFILILALSSVLYTLNKWLFYALDSRPKRPYREQNYHWKYGTIRYIVAGSGEPLLLIHEIGVGRGLHEWSQNIEALSQRYQVYAIDLLGFGSSEKSNITYSPYLYVTLINTFIKEIIQKETYVVANAHSAAIAVLAYYFEPEQYRKLLLISPTGCNSTTKLPTSRAYFLRLLLKSSFIGSFLYHFIASKSYLKWYLSKFCFSNPDNLTDELLDQYHHCAYYGGEASKHVIIYYLVDYLNVHIEHVLPKIHIPVHIIWGSRNVLNPLSNYDVFKKLHPETTLTVFQNAKQFPQIEDPTLFDQVCKEFFA